MEVTHVEDRKAALAQLTCRVGKQIREKCKLERAGINTQS